MGKRGIIMGGKGAWISPAEPVDANRVTRICHPLNSEPHIRRIKIEPSVAILAQGTKGHSCILPGARESSVL